MKYTRITAVAFAALSLWLTGCGGDKPNETTGATTGNTTGTPSSTDAKVSGKVMVDGSSTVEPISKNVEEKIRAKYPDLQVLVNKSGTGGGFTKFAAKEIEIAAASRPIEQTEIDKAKANGVEFIEIPIAYDGLSVVVNKENTFAASLTLDELKKIWGPDSKIMSWKDVRAGFPDTPLKLYGPDTQSGTFDYFTEAINGKKGASRQDYEQSADDEILVRGVSGDKGGLGYFGFAYYEAHKDTLNVVGVDTGKGAVAPSAETIADGTYAPLSRPLFLYVRKDVADRADVKAVVDFFLSDEGQASAKDEGYVPLTAEEIKMVRDRYSKGTTGSMYGGQPAVGLKLKDLLTKAEGANP
jgi:phosphate transport system substrate-binding protein